MGSAVKPEDLSSPLRYHHQADGGEEQGEGQRPAPSARGKCTNASLTAEQRHAEFRYAHLSDDDYDTVTSLMHGTLAMTKIPRVKSKVIKMFISSTFTDMVLERNVLAEQVFPKLRRFCRDKYGVDFQAVDMRWGVPPDARDDHSASELCLAELRHCKDVSIGPNFALLLGQKYGTCPLPAAVVRSQFEAIRMHLEKSGSDVTLLDQCYLRDQNVIPSVYRLQNISKIKETTNVPWNEAEPRLKQMIEDGAKMAVAASDMKADEMRQLLASVTEHEVYQGLIDVQKESDRSNSCILFERDITDLYFHMSDPKMVRFCDVVHAEGEAEGEEAKLNATSQTMLKSLKDTSRQALPRFNYSYSKAEWAEKQGMDPLVHMDHLERLTKHFYHTTRSLVDRNMARRHTLASDPLYHEVVGHWEMVAARCHSFVGREVPLMAVRQYVTEESSQALVIHGESGVGKTSFLAKVASLAHDWMAGLANPVKTSVIVRFNGITPLCSSIQPLLYSVCHQVAFVAGRPREEVPADYKSLKLYFIDLLQRGEVPGVLVIVLDSLDQLSSSNGAHTLDWLPARIAPNIKLIVSTLPTNQGLLRRLQNKVESKWFLQLSPLPATDAERIMKVMLEASDRQVTLPQWRLIQQAFQHCTLPLFITLTFQETLRWRSYDQIPADALKHTVDSSIHLLLDRLEAKHGKVFVSRALAYVTAARCGLSESELEDVLSLDEEVLGSVFTFWLPPIRRLPPSLLPRLYLDMAAFLVQRDADDGSVLSWYHQQFVTAATSRYLSDYVDYVQVHRILSEYYQGTWSGTAQKPFNYSPQLMARLKIARNQGRACRYVPDMPLVFHSSEVCERFNLRKMSQLPYSLIHSRQFDVLRAQCFCNYDWLHAKLRATSVQQVLADFALFEDRETNLVADVLRMSGSALVQDPDRLGAEISGRLLPHVGRYASIRDLVRQCDLAAQMCCPLVPLAQLYAAPGGPLQYECDLEAKSAMDVDVFSTADGILLTAKSYYSTSLKVWELSQGEPRQDLHLPMGAVHPSRDGHHLAILREHRHVSIYKTDSGELHGHVDYKYGEVGQVATGKRYLAISVERGVGPVLVDMEAVSLVQRFAFHSHAVAFSPDEKYFCFNSGHLVLLYTLPLLERKCVGQAADVPQQILFTGHSTKCFLLTQTKMLQSIYFDVTARKHHTNDILQDLAMRDFSLSHSEHLILCRSARCLYLVDAHREKLVYRLQKAPHAVLVETMTAFTGAGFTPDDRLVVASRNTHLFVWNASSGQPLRVLQAALSPLVKLFMSPATNKAVTLLKDNTLQVWNLNNLDADVLHANEIIKGPVKTLSVSSTSGLVACHGGVQGQAEVKLVETSTGRVVSTLQQAEHVDHVSSVALSAGGRYVLTFNVWGPADVHEAKETTINWPLLRNVVLWNTEKSKPVLSKVNCRFALFDRHGASLGMVVCSNYSQFDWTYNLYQFSFTHLESEVCGSRGEMHFEFPENTEFVGSPVLFYDRRSYTWALICVLQSCKKTFIRSDVEGPREFESFVYIRRLAALESGGKNDTDPMQEPVVLRLKDLIRYPEPGDFIAGVALLQTNLLLIQYVKKVNHVVFDSTRGLVIPPDVDKASVLYDVLKGVVVKHTMRILSPSSELAHTLSTPTASVCVDQKLQVFDVTYLRLQCQVEADWLPGSARLALNGRYLVGLSRDRRCLQVYRTSDGAIKGSLLVHGKATHLEVAEDGRTIAVGTSDGRVMLLSLVLELSDPYVELIQHFSSRNPPPTPALDDDAASNTDGLLVDKDAQVIRGTAPELLRLSAKIRSDVQMATRKPASFRSLSNAMLVAQKFQQNRSQACCIQ